MNTVKIATKDGVIWNKHDVFIELYKASLTGPVKIDLLSEGPCCVTSGLESMLLSLVDTFGFSKDLYTIYTSNQLKSSSFNEVRTPFVELRLAQKKAQQVTHCVSSLNKRFASFVSRSNYIRLGLSSYLFKNYRNQTLQTFHFDPTVQYHNENFELERFMEKHNDDIADVFEFVKHLPIKLDDNVTYPILWSVNAFDLDDSYKEIFCEIVYETYYSGKTFFITEKTMRPIINKVPFLIQGPRYVIENLHKLGFKTFNKWWCEAYDNDPWDARYESFKQSIDWIAQQSQDTIKQWRSEMQDTLDHNYNVLLSLTDKKITEMDFYYESE
jgi:hypothetical protein